MVVQKPASWQLAKFGQALLLVFLTIPFALAAWAKVENLTELKRSLESSQIVPHDLIPTAAYAIVGGEVLVVLLLLFPRSRTLGTVGAALMAAAYAGYNVWKIQAGITVPCGCFGELYTMGTWTALLLCLSLFAAACVLLRSLVGNSSGRGMHIGGK